MNRRNRRWLIVAGIIVLILLIVLGRAARRAREEQPATPAPTAGAPTSTAGPTAPPATAPPAATPSPARPPATAPPATAPPATAPPAATRSPAGGAADAPACAVQAIRRLAEGGDGDWSRATNLLLFDRKDANDTYQVYSMAPDGSQLTCLTCAARPGGPGVDRHKVNPTWYPSGGYFVAQVEMENYANQATTSKLLGGSLILNGFRTNLYAASADGQRWWRLTDYSATKADGALAPHFSADGRRLLWSRMVAPGNPLSANPFGRWRLLVADFVLDADGVPSLRNERDITPAGGNFVEAHGFSPDGRRAIFAADIGLADANGMDIFTLDLTTGQPRNLTNSPDQWDEHASYAPNGKLIAYMSSAPNPGFQLNNTLSLRPEIVLMNADGSGSRPITHFNALGYPESSQERALPARPIWNAEGSQLMLTVVLAGRSYPARSMWLLTFAGPCGG